MITTRIPNARNLTFDLSDWFSLSINSNTKKPPDPKSVRKRKLRKERSQWYKTLLLTLTVPHFLTKADLDKTNFLKGFLGSEGILRTNDLSNSMINNLRGMIDEDLRDEMLNVKGMECAVCDTGCSIICTPFKNDFILDTLTEFHSQRSMRGIVGDLQVTFQGTIKYTTLDRKGRTVTIERPGVLVPSLPIRLIPLQQIMRTRRDGYYKVNGEEAVLEFSNGQLIDTPINPKTNLPYLCLYSDLDNLRNNVHQAMYNCVSKESNQNMNELPKEMLRWHWRIVHRHFGLI